MKQKILKVLYNFLALCARIYISRHKIQVIAITGSVGKTSCRMIVAQVLQQLQGGRKIYTSPKNFNSELGLVFSVFQIEEYTPSIQNLLKLSGKIFLQSFFGAKNTDILVAEYGIDAPGDMDHLLKIAKPDIAVLTKLDRVHSANFPLGIEQYWGEKWKLLLAAPKVYLNLSDEYSVKNIGLLDSYSEIFGETNPVSQLELAENETPKRVFEYAQKTISINLLGEENVVYVQLGLSIAEDLAISLSEGKELGFDFSTQPGRFSIFERNNAVLIDSSYNAAPESMKLVLGNVVELRDALYPNRKLIAVLGDMRELGDLSAPSHQSLAASLSDFSSVYTVGPEMYQHLVPALRESGFSGEIHSSLSSREIGKNLKKYLKDHASEEYVVVFKGGQNTIFTEEALSGLLTPTQRKNLVRSSLDWKQKKEDFFRSL